VALLCGVMNQNSINATVNGFGKRILPAVNVHHLCIDPKYDVSV
jgi:hypothetical protein